MIEFSQKYLHLNHLVGFKSNMFKKIMAELQKQKIINFNHHPTVKFMVKLLDIRESGLWVLVPDLYRPFLEKPTPREPHYNLTRLLIHLPLLPPSSNLSKEMKGYIDQIKKESASEPFGKEEKKLQIDSSFWPIALNPNRGASGIYTWEHLLYREVFNDYLLLLDSLMYECNLLIKNFGEALEIIPSLHFLTVPIRFYLGDGIYASETILFDFIKTSHPNLYNRLFGSDTDDPGIVKCINPVIIEDSFGSYFKIADEEERKIIHDPTHPVDPSYMDDEDDEDDGGYSIYWWFPDSLSIHLDETVKESKITDFD